MQLSRRPEGGISDYLLKSGTCVLEEDADADIDDDEDEDRGICSQMMDLINPRSSITATELEGQDDSR